MFTVKLLATSSAVAAGAWIWSNPNVWSLLLHVLGALVLSWAVFVAVVYLTALHLRRTPAQSRIARPLAPAVRAPRNYAERLDRDAG